MPLNKEIKHVNLFLDDKTFIFFNSFIDFNIDVIQLFFFSYIFVYLS